MKTNDIKQDETYMFVATDSPARKHLEGQPFTVKQIKAVWRRLTGGRRKVKRFFNENGEAARAEELEPMPVGGPMFPNFDKLKHVATDTDAFDQAVKAAGDIAAGFQAAADAAKDLAVPPKKIKCMCGWSGTDKDIPIIEEVRFAAGGLSFEPGLIVPEKRACPSCREEILVEDNREFACNSCNTGEYVQKGYTQPNGRVNYECTECGHEVSFP